MAKLTQAELERHLWQAADILRGTVDSGDYKQYIFGLLFYKRLCDVWDEEYEKLLQETGDKAEAADPEEHRFHVPFEHRWDEVRKHSTQIGQRLNNAFNAIEDANLRLKGVFGTLDFAKQDQFPDALLEKLLSHFEKHRLRNADITPDVLGDAYMYLIKMFAEGSGKKGGEFYTPRQVVRLMVECLDPQPGMSIYDPTCGSGGMLLEAVQYLKDRGQDVRALSLYGQEKNLSTWAIAQINLFLHGIDDAFIAKGDTILNPKRYEPRARDFTAGLGTYDRVLANPPFSEKVWGHEVWDSGDPFGRDSFGCPPKGNGDMAFVQHMLASTAKNGRVGVVIPHGVLFRGDAEGRIRQAMLRSNVVDGLIGLAPNLFYGTPVPAAILFLRRRAPDERTIRIVNAAEIFRSGKAKNRLEDSDVQYITDAYRSTLDIEHVAKTVSVDDIANNDYNLNIDYFVPPKNVGAGGDVNSTLEELKLLISRRNDAEFEMFEQLRKAGYEQ